MLLFLFKSDGCNRWFDKSVQFIIFENGKSGLNMEHSGTTKQNKTNKTKQKQQNKKKKKLSTKMNEQKIDFDGTTLINLAQFIHTKSQTQQTKSRTKKKKKKKN
jgi:hypothetical protein